MVMFTGTAEQFNERRAQALELAEQVAALLDRIDALGVGAATGQLLTPGGTIRRAPGRPAKGWTVS
ncbi:hypothetical protein ABR737_01680 [Streptomyces sp. Edi2]|uniref:hypothetical protein n=1 Tax=Streptomyces sp. Edi2 TaxID=3162528 RepID=UPI0033061D6F